jgi:hypothetical protein
MFKYALLLGLVLPATGFAADYNGDYIGGRRAGDCHMQQDGTVYCIEVPVEKFIADCSPGVDCHHMQSGQHYSVQSPVVLND